MPTREELGWPPNAARGTRQKVGEFEREVAFRAGHPNTPGTGPSSNYGVGSLEITFLLHGAKGSVQFSWSTGIVPEKVTRHVDPTRDWDPKVTDPFTKLLGVVRPFDIKEWRHDAPMGFDVGYHADEPQYEGQTARDDCDLRPSGKCYYDGSGLAGERFLTEFLTKGEDVMWALLERRYAIWFEGAEWVEDEP